MGYLPVPFCADLQQEFILIEVVGQNYIGMKYMSIWRQIAALGLHTSLLASY